MITFSAQVWVYKGKGAWHFVTLPQQQAEQVRFLAVNVRTGWRSVPVKVQIGSSVWKTSLFPEKSSASFVLPLKMDIRQHERITEGDTITVTLDVL